MQNDIKKNLALGSSDPVKVLVSLDIKLTSEVLPTKETKRFLIIR